MSVLGKKNEDPASLSVPHATETSQLLSSSSSSWLSSTMVAGQAYESIQDRETSVTTTTTASTNHNNGVSSAVGAAASSSTTTSLDQHSQHSHGSGDPTVSNGVTGRPPRVPPTTTTTAPGLFQSKELIQLVVIAAATAATLGFDVGIMAAAIQPLEREFRLNSVQKEVAMGSLNFVAAVGALLGGRISNQRGRKPTVRVCAWLFVVGTVLMAIAPTYAWLLVGRIVTGIGVGVSFVVAPVYLSEVAPTHLRGQLNTVFDVAINGGILFGYVAGFAVQVCLPGGGSVKDDSPLVNSLKWRIMLGLGILLPVVVLANLNALPESPRWLVMKNQTDQAHQVLGDLGEHPRQILRTVSSIQDELMNEVGEQASLWRWSPGMRLAVALGFWQQITGTEAVLYYSADFLAHAGLESATQRLLGNCFVGLCKLVPELIAMQLVDTVGRRPLILGSAVSLMFSTATLAIAFWQSWSPMVVVLLLCAIMASFSIGLGPFSFLVASENLGLTERATGVTLCAAANRCTSGSVALTAVSLYEGLGPAGLFAIYAALGAASLPFYFTAVNETSGQSLEEIAARHRGIPDHRNQHRSRGQQEPFADVPEVDVTGTMA